MARYYSTQRPVMPGGFPRKADVVEIKNFDAKTLCEEIGKEAWGYIEYQGELTKEEAEAFGAEALAEADNTDETQH